MSQATCIGILYNPLVKEAIALSGQVEAYLEELNRNVWLSSIDGANEIHEQVEYADLLVVLGGDGTTLSAARLGAIYDIPVFGINLGRVGFLSEAHPNAWSEKLGLVLQGNYWIERRLMLKAHVIRAGNNCHQMIALNDVVVSRGAQVRVVRFHLYVDDVHVTTYTADGLIIATPTGSTAYSMAAGGPLLPPELQNYLVLPVAPHLSFERPLVLHQEAIVKVRVEMEHEAIATADGQPPNSLQSGDEVIVSKYAKDGLFARVDSPGYFYHRLMQRLSYWSRKL